MRIRTFGEKVLDCLNAESTRTVGGRKVRVVDAMEKGVKSDLASASLREK